MKSFEVEVKTLVEAKLILDTLAQYDLFQWRNRVKPDYSNAGGLVYWDVDAQGWWDWYSDDGENIDFYTLEELRELENKS